jgi:dihydroneopterin aldolase
MQHVFDYDPLIARISELANSRHFETQEYLVSLIARECAAEQLIEGADIFLYKTPVNASSGELGVRLVLDKTDLNQMRERTHSR